MNEIKKNLEVNNLNGNGTINNVESNYSGNLSKEGVSSKKKGSNKLVIIVIILLLLLLLAAFGGVVYDRLVVSKNIFKMLIQNTFTYLEENVNNHDTVIGTFELKVGGTSSDHSTNSMLDIMSKLDLSGSYGIDYKNKIANLDVYTKYENEKLLNSSVYMEDNNGYIELKEIYDKYIQIPVQDYNNLFSSNEKNDDYKVILRSVNKALTGSLKDEYFTKEKVVVRDVKTTKTTLNLSKKNYNLMKKDFIHALLNDNEFLKSSSSISDKSVDEVKKELNNYLKEENFEGIDVSIYTKGFKNEFVQLEIVNSTDSIIIMDEKDSYRYQVMNNNKLMYDGSLKVDSGKDVVTCDFTVNDKEENNTITFKMTSSVKYNEVIQKVNVSNSIGYEELTTDDINSISTKILDNKTFMRFVEDISSLSTDFDSSVNYDLGSSGLSSS